MAAPISVALAWLKLRRTSVQFRPRQSRHKIAVVNRTSVMVFRCLRKLHFRRFQSQRYRPLNRGKEDRIETTSVTRSPAPESQHAEKKTRENYLHSNYQTGNCGNYDAQCSRRIENPEAGMFPRQHRID